MLSLSDLLRIQDPFFAQRLFHLCECLFIRITDGVQMNAMGQLTERFAFADAVQETIDIITGRQMQLADQLSIKGMRRR